MRRWLFLLVVGVICLGCVLRMPRLLRPAAAAASSSAAAWCWPCSLLHAFLAHLKHFLLCPPASRCFAKRSYCHTTRAQVLVFGGLSFFPCLQCFRSRNYVLAVVGGWAHLSEGCEPTVLYKIDNSNVAIERPTVCRSKP